MAQKICCILIFLFLVTHGMEQHFVLQCTPTYKKSPAVALIKSGKLSVIEWERTHQLQSALQAKNYFEQAIAYNSPEAHLNLGQLLLQLVQSANSDQLSSIFNMHPEVDPKSLIITTAKEHLLRVSDNYPQAFTCLINFMIRYNQIEKAVQYCAQAIFNAANNNKIKFARAVFDHACIINHSEIITMLQRHARELLANENPAAIVIYNLIKSDVALSSQIHTRLKHLGTKRKLECPDQEEDLVTETKRIAIKEK